MGLGHKNGRRGRAYQEERPIKVLTQSFEALQNLPVSFS